MEVNLAMIQIKAKQIQLFQKEIFTWYARHQRDLPWRRDRDPYHILVSEIMLQQTQVARVIPKYEAWLKAFPGVHSLAKATTTEVLRLWSGLGYNRRALYLQKSAQTLVQMSSSYYRHSRESGNPWIPDQVGDDSIVWPRSVVDLKKLPGIGEYTAAAIACFAFNEQIAVVDTNIRKVILTRFCHPERSEGSHKIDSSPSVQNDSDESASIVLNDFAMTEKEIQELADKLLPKGKAYEWNQALMDYAAIMLKQEKIPIKKQSTFKNSDRYFRGWIIRLLVERGEMTIKQLMELFAKDADFVDTILAGLEKDGLIVRKKDSLTLA